MTTDTVAPPERPPATGSSGQTVIDLIVGFRVGARTEVPAISHSTRERPGFEAFFHGAAPALGIAAVAVPALVAATRRQMPTWPAVTFFVAGVCIGSGITVLMIIGGVASCVAPPAMVRPARLAPPSDAARVAVVS